MTIKTRPEVRTCVFKHKFITSQDWKNNIWYSGKKSGIESEFYICPHHAIWFHLLSKLFHMNIGIWNWIDRITTPKSDKI